MSVDVTHSAPGAGDPRELSREMRRVSVVIAGTIVLWLCLQWLGGALGLPPILALVFDFAALVALVWSLGAIYRIWRLRQSERTGRQG